MDYYLNEISSDVYKNFIYQLRKKEFEDVYIPITEHNTEKLKEYVKQLIAVPFEDGLYHSYYGSVKKLISSFIIFFHNIIDDLIIDADKYINEAFKDDLEFLVDKALSMHEKHQVIFGKEFLPITTQKEKDKYEEIQKEYDVFLKKMHDLKNKIIKIDNQDKVVEYVKEHFSKAARNMSYLFEFTYVYLGRMLSVSLDKIRASLDENRLRMTNNLTQLTAENEDILTNMMLELYDKNQINLSVRRRSRKMSMALAEIKLSIRNLKEKIEKHQPCPSIARLEEEVAHWNKRLNDFNEVAEGITSVLAFKTKMQATLDNYNSKKCTELPTNPKALTWKNIGDNLHAENDYLEKKLTEAVKSLMTFFACRGTDRTYYTNDIGVFYVDSFNHQVYVKDDGLTISHLDCNGDFTQFPDNAYFFDKFGRYFINQAKEKVYQCDPCTSHYDLGKDDLLNKVTKDCGHSNIINQDCKMEITDPNIFELLPHTKPIDITHSLPAETVRYLWAALGAVLPAALYDVGTACPRNPIHYLAHKLLRHKYRCTKQEFEKKNKEAQKYQSDIFLAREINAIETSIKWISKQAKRPRDEVFDITEMHATYNAAMANQMFVEAINFSVNDYPANPIPSGRGRVMSLGNNSGLTAIDHE